MENPYQAVSELVSSHDRLESAVNESANKMAQLLAMNEGAALHRVSPYHLKRIKKLLRRFDMTTGSWK